MKWRRRRRSRHLDDQRAGGPSSGIPIGRAGVGGGIGLVVVLLVVFLSGGLSGDGSGVDIGEVLEGLGGAQAAPGSPIPPEADPQAELVDFISFVLDDVQATWVDIFERSGEQYRPATLTLFTDAVDTGCGLADSNVGPFYCPPDQHVYLDLGFFRELRSRFGAPGDFAQAYVIAHELAHHVQNQLGISDRVTRGQREDASAVNELSIRLELQADCFAGVWAFTAKERRLLEAGDVREALEAAAAVGDDRIQQETTGRIDREVWTHGSAEQRQTWFERGFARGDPNACDTFSADL